MANIFKWFKGTIRQVSQLEKEKEEAREALIELLKLQSERGN